MAADDDLREVMAEERSRGVTRKKIDIEQRRKTARTKRDLAAVLKSGDEIAFMKILRENGLKDGMSEFEKALKVFRAERGRRH
jgi:hypothetical protein